jgi:RimJ/RimL family protein N-acetyltransferase
VTTTPGPQPSPPAPAADVLPVRTDRLVLRLFTSDDLDGLYSLQSRPDVVRFVPYGVRDREEVRGGIEERLRTPAMDADGQVLRLAAELSESGAFVGELTLFLRSVEHRQGEIGFMLHPDVHGQGLASEAAAACLDLMFDWLGLHRVVGQCDARNTASATLMRRLGMRQEAHLVHSEIFKGEWSDLLVFAVLRDEWRAARG